MTNYNPVVVENAADAATRHLLDFHAANVHFQLAVGSSFDSAGTPTPWIYYEKPLAMVEGSGRPDQQGDRAVSITLSAAGGWAPPNEHNTFGTPRIKVEFKADPDRGDDGSMVWPNATDKILRAEAYVRRCLHILSGHDEWWPALPLWYREQLPAPLGYEQTSHLRVTRSVPLNVPEFFDVPDTDGMVRAETFYGVGASGAILVGPS